jgi:hypothetical protein
MFEVKLMSNNQRIGFTFKLPTKQMQNDITCKIVSLIKRIGFSLSQNKLSDPSSETKGNNALFLC